MLKLLELRVLMVALVSAIKPVVFHTDNTVIGTT